MNEKELLEIEQGLRSKIQEEWPTWEQIEQLITEVRRLKEDLRIHVQENKSIAVNNNLVRKDLQLYKDLYTNVNTQNMKYKKALEIAKEEAEKEYIRGVKDTQCELIPKINYEKEQKNIWCDSWDREVGQNKRYKQALDEIAQSTIFTTHATEREKFLIDIFVKLVEIANKALEVDTNE